MGEWYLKRKYGADGKCKKHCSMNDPLYRERCQQLPAEYVKSCELFADWGWTNGEPKNVKYRVVECPKRFEAWVQERFGPEGVTDNRVSPTITTTSTTTTSVVSAMSGQDTTSVETRNYTQRRRTTRKPEFAVSPEEPAGSNLALIVVLSSVGSVCLLASCSLLVCFNAMHWRLRCSKLCRRSNGMDRGTSKAVSTAPRHFAPPPPRGIRDQHSPRTLNPEIEFEL
jgi:hypothetical protein